MKAINYNNKDLITYKVIKTIFNVVFVYAAIYLFFCL